MMRQNAQIGQIRGVTDAFFNTFQNEASQRGISIGKALGDSLKNALLQALTHIGKQAIVRLSKWATSILSNALGLTGTPGAGGIGGAAVGIAGKILGGANDNYAPGAVTQMPLAPIGSDLLGRSASVIRSMESSGNYGALGPLTASGDRAYGAYQVMGANIGPWTKSALGYSMSPQEFLGSKTAQDAVFSQRFGGYLSKYGPSGAAQAWFGGPGSVGSGGGAADVLGTTGTSYVARFNDQLGKATAGLGTFGSGLGNLGQSLANVFPAAPQSSGGGIFGFLGNLFGGGRSLSATAMAAVARGGGGLYDVGGYTGPGGRLEPAGIVHRGEYVFDAASTNRIGVSNLERMRKLPGYAAGGYVRALPHANNNGSGAGSAGGMHISIGWARGASGMLEPAIMDVVNRDAPGIARKQSQGAIAEYHENQRRGGFGTLQKQYSAQKG
jgi:hypothetical protein